jgi:sugar phosphate isomerase/epimerase
MSMKKLAVQMYTIREFTKTAKDLAESLKRCADMGYTAVQVSAVGAMGGDTPEVSAAQMRQMLDDNGLACIATHRPLQALLTKVDDEIEFHQTLGCDYAAFGGIFGDDRCNPDAYRKFVADAAKVIPQYKAAGIRFGHHNHSHEFVRTPEGLSLEDILIEEGGPDLMLELDLYWVEHAGCNCVRWLERCHGRVPVIHLKDKEVTPDDGPVIAPIGEGNMDWAHIIPACEAAGVRWYAIEQDTCRRDPFDCLKSSYEYLTAMGL